MTGGLIQLVAYGVQDLFLTKDPQITFFKIVYRRHTNFSTEVIPQNFTHIPDFGKRVTCILSRDGDLVRNVHLVVTLPRIPTFKDEDNNLDQLTKFAWVKRIGYALISRVEIELGDELIDRQYGDWMNIWHELVGPKGNSIDRMLGDVEELTEFSNGKTFYKLFIPLEFWFCRITGLALPVISLQYNHIKINVEINEFENCYIIAPTHYINVSNDLVNFKQYEFVQQTLNGITSTAVFVFFDILNQRLYFNRVSDEQFQSPTIDIVDTTPYKIIGLESRFEATPVADASEKVHLNTTVNFNKIVLKEAFLLVEYIYLDIQERVRFAQSKHEYLIEQILFDGEKTIDGLHQPFKLGLIHPCKELIWVTQLSLVQKTRLNDHFNYTNSPIRIDGELIGTDIIREETILFNGHERIKFRESEYFSQIQPYQHHSYAPPVGINLYSFALFPEKHQPSGIANLSKIDNILLRLSVDVDIDFQNTGKLRTYAVVYNILRIAAGISGLVFSTDR